MQINKKSFDKFFHLLEEINMRKELKLEDIKIGDKFLVKSCDLGFGYNSAAPDNSLIKTIGIIKTRLLISGIEKEIDGVISFKSMVLFRTDCYITPVQFLKRYHNGGFIKPVVDDKINTTTSWFKKEDAKDLIWDTDTKKNPDVSDKKCKCSMQTILSVGCQCGGV
jgi:hypothetical protein